MSEPKDLITGQLPPDSDDEPYRQAIEAQLLAAGYEREQIAVDAERSLTVEGRCVCVKADLLVSLGERPAMLIRVSRDSLVTRENETVATARLISDPWPPLALVSNSRQAELLDTASAQVLASGPQALPDPAELERLLASRPAHSPSPRELSQAARVYEAMSFIHCPPQCTV